MPADAYLGIDVGTSSVKAVAVSTDGTVLATGDSPLSVTVLQPGWAEQRPEDWWEATCRAVNAVAVQLESPTQIRGIGFSGQMHSLVALDQNQQVIRPAILWSDVRTSEQCEVIYDRVGPEKLRDLCGNPALEGFTATKLLWLRQHEPGNFERIRHVMLAKDYVRFRMTGEIATDPSDASGTLLFSPARMNWSPDMCALLEINPLALPQLVESSGFAGEVTANAAEQLGINERTPVVTGGADNACAAAGSGVVAPNTMLVTIGTSGAVVAPTPEPSVDPLMRIHSMAHAENDTWYLMGVVLSAGAALAWWRGAAGSPSFDDLVAAAKGVAPGSDGLTFLPYLTGERTPHADADARGVFAGLNASHTQAHMTRAVLEGVAFALKDSVQLMRPLGAVPGSAVAVGGGARSETWRQILADVLGIPLKMVGPAEGAPLGAAMLAAVGAKAFGSVTEAGDAWLRTEGQTEPVESNSATYQQAYDRYTSLYPALENWFASGSQP